MIRNDQELTLMRERVAKFEKLLGVLRQSAWPGEWPYLSLGYRIVTGKGDVARGEVATGLESGKLWRPLTCRSRAGRANDRAPTTATDSPVLCVASLPAARGASCAAADRTGP